MVSTDRLTLHQRALRVETIRFLRRLRPHLSVLVTEAALPQGAPHRVTVCPYASN